MLSASRQYTSCGELYWVQLPHSWGLSRTLWCYVEVTVGGNFGSTRRGRRCHTLKADDTRTPLMVFWSPSHQDIVRSLFYLLMRCMRTTTSIRKLGVFIEDDYQEQWEVLLAYTLLFPLEPSEQTRGISSAVSVRLLPVPLMFLAHLSLLIFPFIWHTS